MTKEEKLLDSNKRLRAQNKKLLGDNNNMSLMVNDIRAELSEARVCNADAHVRLDMTHKELEQAYEKNRCLLREADALRLNLIEHQRNSKTVSELVAMLADKHSRF